MIWSGFTRERAIVSSCPSVCLKVAFAPRSAVHPHPPGLAGRDEDASSFPHQFFNQRASLEHMAHSQASKVASGQEGVGTWGGTGAITPSASPQPAWPTVPPRAWDRQSPGDALEPVPWCLSCLLISLPRQGQFMSPEHEDPASPTQGGSTKRSLRMGFSFSKASNTNTFCQLHHHPGPWRNGFLHRQSVFACLKPQSRQQYGLRVHELVYSGCRERRL